jgi:hypothetical protein
MTLHVILKVASVSAQALLIFAATALYACADAGGAANTHASMDCK